MLKNAAIWLWISKSRSKFGFLICGTFRKTKKKNITKESCKQDVMQMRINSLNNCKVLLVNKCWLKTMDNNIKKNERKKKNNNSINKIKCHHYYSCDTRSNHMHTYTDMLCTYVRINDFASSLLC